MSHPLPQIVAPDWYAVNMTIPRWFRDDGPSVPKPLVLFRGVVAIVAPRWMARWYAIARAHDWGYWFGRLPGSGWDHVPKDAWDNMLAAGMSEYGSGWWGRIARRGLATRISRRAWDRAGAEMERRGWLTYADALRDHEQPT